MALQNFVSKNLPAISAAWLNRVDRIAEKYATTAAETAAIVTVVNDGYPPYTVDRYATNTTPGITDMWQAIFNADKAANLAGAAVTFLPGSLYAVDCSTHAAALTQSASWLCAGFATIQRKDFTASASYYTVTQTGQTGIHTEGLIFDGQLTTAASNTPNIDLAAIGSYADTTNEALWRKVYGVRTFNATRVSYNRCVFKNFLRAGLRIDGDGLTGGFSTISKDIKITNCNVIRTRGSSGDGIYLGGVTDAKISNTHVYDYQRIAFVEEFAPSDNATGDRDIAYVNCTADLGHDAVLPESNFGFWSECGDNITRTNCIVKNGSGGFAVNAGPESDTGTTRPFVANFGLYNCSAIRCQLPINLSFGGSRSVRVAVDGFFGEADKSITYATNGLPVRAGILVRVSEVIVGTSYRIDIKNTEIHALNQSTGSVANAFGCFRMLQGVVTNPQNLIVNIEGFQTRWSVTAGTDDSGALTDYRNATNGYFGDIVFGGEQDISPASRFRGHATISGLHNHTFGYALVSSEIFSALSNLTFAKSRLVMRPASLASNGILSIESCPLFDFRGDIGFTSIQITNSTIRDSDTGTTSRTSQSATMVTLTGNTILRQYNQNMAGGDATHRKLRIIASGNFWNISFNTESGLKLTASNGTYFHALLNGNAFKNLATGAMGATKSMIEVASDNTSLPQLSGAGNSFDSAMVTAGGHVLQISTAPTYNDAPQTAAGNFLTVMGVLAVWDPV